MRPAAAASADLLALRQASLRQQGGTVHASARGRRVVQLRLRCRRESSLKLLASTLITHMFELTAATGRAQMDQRLVFRDGHAWFSSFRVHSTRGSTYVGSSTSFWVRGSQSHIDCLATLPDTSAAHGASE